MACVIIVRYRANMEAFSGVMRVGLVMRGILIDRQ
jgi:hypothetical protein